jgi:N-succinyldiaminopimelate aminotransferase
VERPAGGYFAVADIAPLGLDDGVRFCADLPARVGVAAIPASAFYDDGRPARTLVRFAYCKRPEVIDAALDRLGALAA